MISEVYVLVGHGAGVYRNDETGLERKFDYPPVRGKWTMIRPARIRLEVAGGIIQWRRARQDPSHD